MTSATGRKILLNGFTLVELCFTITIIGLIAGMCWPSLKSVAQSLSARSSATAFAQQLQVAREHAVLSGSTQVVRAPATADAQTTAVEATLLPDGTAARPMSVYFGPTGHALASVELDATGHVLLTIPPR